MSLIETMTRATNSLNMEADSKLAPLNLTSRRMVVLRALITKGLSRAVDLTEHTGIDRSTMATILHGLRKIEYIERKRAHDDNRAWIITVTPDGRESFRQGQKIIDQIEKSVSKRLGAPAFAQVNQSVASIHAA